MSSKIGNGIPLSTFDLKVTLPTDYVHDYGFISAWIDNVQVSTDQYASKVEIGKLGTATFKISTEKSKVNVTIKLSADNSSYDNYITYTVDAKSGVVTNILRHAYPQKMDPGSNDTNTSGSVGTSSQAPDETE